MQMHDLLAYIHSRQLNTYMICSPTQYAGIVFKSGHLHSFQRAATTKKFHFLFVRVVFAWCPMKNKLAQCVTLIRWRVLNLLGHVFACLWPYSIYHFPCTLVREWRSSVVRVSQLVGKEVDPFG